MGAFVIVIVFIALFAIVWSLCFVGCNGFNTGIIDCTDYQQKVIQTPGLIAFWPLDETSGTTAADIGPNNFNGTYTIGPDVSTYDPVNLSDAAPGTYTLGQPNIVAGDCDSTTPNPCVAVDGGYVSVPWQAALGPGQSPFQFTLEVWVIPEWTLEDAQNNPSNRVVVASNAVGTFQGFSILASSDNLWAATLGIGSQNLVVTTGNNQTIIQNSLYFLVLTYDGNNLTLWVNPADTTQPPDGQAAGPGFVPVASPIPFYIGIGNPNVPTPRNPFNGQIQDVAFYNVVLDGKTIGTHYLNGSGLQTS
jgi:Concanavalin A-like lectin/glucanases superfamily